MKEERVTKNILEWLADNNWAIVCYDFPQSGTGVLLHQNKELHTTKNKGSIIPDIIAVKNGIALFFENKDRFVLSDFEKLKSIKSSGNYSDGLDNLLKDYNIKTFYYGIGIPAKECDIKKSLAQLNNIDLLISVEESGDINVNYDLNKIFP